MATVKNTVPLFLENIKNAQRQIISNYDTIIATCDTYINKGIDRTFYSGIRAKAVNNKREVLLSIQKS